MREPLLATIGAQRRTADLELFFGRRRRDAEGSEKACWSNGTISGGRTLRQWSRAVCEANDVSLVQ